MSKTWKGLFVFHCISSALFTTVCFGQSPEPPVAAPGSSPEKASEEVEESSKPLARAEVAELSKRWRDLSNAEFVQALVETRKRPKNRSLIAMVDKQIYREAMRRLIEESAIAKEENYATLSSLLRHLRKQLSEGNLSELRTVFARRPAPDLSQLDPATMVHRTTLMQRMGMPKEAALEIHRWLPHEKWRDAELNYLVRLYTYLMDADIAANYWFRVTWRGKITPAKSGTYTFSADTLVTSANPDRDAQHGSYSDLKVTVDGVVVLDTAAEESDQHKAIPLAADKPAMIQIEFVNEHPGKSIPTNYPAIARLYWESANVRREVVPAESFSLPDEIKAEKSPIGNRGLYGEYQYRSSQRASATPLVLHRVDPQVDFYWTTGGSFGSAVTTGPHMSKFIAHVADVYSHSADLDVSMVTPKAAANETGTLRMLSELLPAAERGRFLNVLSGRQELVSILKHDQVGDLFTMFRCGADQEALNFVGTWLAHPSRNWNAITWKNETKLREQYAHWARILTNEYPDQLSHLRANHLARSDKSCANGIAAVLAYAYLNQDELSNWINEIDSSLAALDQNSPARVSWLLVRAHAEEIKNRKSEKDDFEETPEAGLPFVEEAAIAAQDEGDLLVVAKAQFSRIASVGNEPAASNYLVELQSRLSSEHAKQEFAAWNRELNFAADDAAANKDYKRAACFQRLAKLLPESKLVVAETTN